MNTGDIVSVVPLEGKETGVVAPDGFFLFTERVVEAPKLPAPTGPLLKLPMGADGLGGLTELWT